MVASVHPSKLPEHSKTQNKGPMASNRVLMVLMRRLHNSKSFGENLIFMLNRAGGCIHMELLRISSDFT